MKQRVVMSLIDAGQKYQMNDLQVKKKDVSLYNIKMNHFKEYTFNS